MQPLKHIIARIRSEKTLTTDEYLDIFKGLIDRSAIQQSSLLTMLSLDSYSEAQLQAGLTWLLDAMIPILYHADALDIVGTGGDQHGTFNISTAASILAASCGVCVAKHGGRKVSSQSGASDVIGALGIHVEDKAEKIVAQLNQNQFAFIAAPLFNPILRTISPIRQELGFASIFNLLGPLINPLRPVFRVIGVNHRNLVRPICELLSTLPIQRAWVVHSDEGLDELSICAPNHIAEYQDSKITEFVLDPNQYGFKNNNLSELKGGSPDENAEIIRAIFANQLQGAKRDVVVFNAAAALLVCARVSRLEDGITLAQACINNGKALAKLNQLRGFIQ